jgi:hypothetical protein
MEKAKDEGLDGDEGDLVRLLLLAYVSGDVELGEPTAEAPAARTSRS